MSKSRTPEPQASENETGPYQGYQASSAQIAEWKAKYKEVHAVEVEDKDGSKLRVYCKSPDRGIMAAATKFGMNDPMKFNETMYESCKLEGDIERVQKDDMLYLSAIACFSAVVELRKATLKKL